MMKISRDRVIQIIREELNGIYEVAAADPMPVGYTDQPPPESTGIDDPQHQEMLSRVAQTNLDVMWADLTSITAEDKNIYHTLNTLEQFPADEQPIIWSKMQELYVTKVTEHNASTRNPLKKLPGDLISALKLELSNLGVAVGVDATISRFKALGDPGAGATAGMEDPGLSDPELSYLRSYDVWR